MSPGVSVSASVEHTPPASVNGEKFSATRGNGISTFVKKSFKVTIGLLLSHDPPEPGPRAWHCQKRPYTRLQ